MVAVVVMMVVVMVGIFGSGNGLARLFWCLGVGDLPLLCRLFFRRLLF